MVNSIDEILEFLQIMWHKNDGRSTNYSFFKQRMCDRFFFGNHTSYCTRCDKNYGSSRLRLQCLVKRRIQKTITSQSRLAHKKFLCHLFF